MKTITIPSNYDPFRVTVNGKEYVYQGGSTVSVPDDVADVIENMIKPEYAEHSNFATLDDINNLKAYVDDKLTGKEAVRNKVNEITDASTNVNYPSVPAVKSYVKSVERRRIHLPDTLQKDGTTVASVNCFSTSSNVRVVFAYKVDSVNFSIAETDKVSFVDFGEELLAEALSTGIATLDGFAEDNGQSFSINNGSGILTWTFVFSSSAYAESAATAISESLPTECTILVEPSMLITAEVV